MNENVSLDKSGAYQKLGEKTFLMFIFNKMSIPFIFLFLSIALFIFQGSSVLKNISIPDIQYYLNLSAWISMGIFFLSLIFVVLISWLTYINYTFAITDFALKIRRGILSREEIAIPYRQIQDVDINQDISYRLLGLSELVILTAGNQEDKVPNDETEGILPVLDSKLAKQIQAELLARANIQTVVDENKPVA
jgi:uncharacterized membrane protein YdbT with pleckstrin-like domain